MKTATIALLISAIVLPAAPLLAQGGRICSDGRTVHQQCEIILQQADNDTRVNYMTECARGTPGRDAVFEYNVETRSFDQLHVAPASAEQCMALGGILFALNFERFTTCTTLNLCQ